MLQTHEKKPAAVFNFNGTLVDITCIRHLVTGTRRDPVTFHRSVLLCPPRTDVVEAARQAHEEGLIVLIFTGMPEEYRSSATLWLQGHNVPYAHLWMRPDGDDQKNFAVKRDMFLSASTMWSITKAWDDDPEVLDMWDAHGIPAVRVPGWFRSLG